MNGTRTIRTRDQERALHAYKSVEDVPKEWLDEYKIAVNGLGSYIMRNGLAATMAYLERERERKAVERLADHLAEANIPGLERCSGKDLPRVVRSLPLDDYQVATREILKLLVWFRRAVRARSLGKEDPHDAR